MSDVDIIIGDETFAARFRDDLAPLTCATFRSMFPWQQRLVHARWSGEACWIPLGGLHLDVPCESATSYPRPGELIFYPGGLSEPEILLPYGSACFASKAGQLAGNPFLSISDGLDRLARVCGDILWSGSREIRFRSASDRVETISGKPL